MTTILALLGCAALFALAGFVALQFGGVEAPRCGGCEKPGEACGGCPLATTICGSTGADPVRHGGEV